MKVLDSDYDLETGFFWIIVDGKNEGDRSTVQCCLVFKQGRFVESITQSDCGNDWGICGDVNEQAFKYWGQNRCMKALFHAAKQAGLELLD